MANVGGSWLAVVHSCLFLSVPEILQLLLFVAFPLPQPPSAVKGWGKGKGKIRRRRGAGTRNNTRGRGCEVNGCGAYDPSVRKRPPGRNRLVQAPALGCQ